jgi:hypothetical protein
MKKQGLTVHKKCEVCGKRGKLPPGSPKMKTKGGRGKPTGSPR